LPLTTLLTSYYRRFILKETDKADTSKHKN